MTREEAKDKWLLHIDYESICKAIDDIYDIYEEDIKYKNEELKQLNDAISIVANKDGDYTQNIVYDALVETGYYEGSDPYDEE